MFKNSINNCLYCFMIIPESEQMRRRKGRQGLKFKRKNLKLPVFIDYSESQSKVSLFPWAFLPYMGSPVSYLSATHVSGIVSLRWVSSTHLSPTRVSDRRGGKIYDAAAMVSLFPGAHVSRTALLRVVVGPLNGGPRWSPWVTGDRYALEKDDLAWSYVPHSCLVSSFITSSHWPQATSTIVNEISPVLIRVIGS